MAKQGKGGISWCDFTFNGWIGCTKVGPGCDHCYAEARDIRFTGGKHWGAGAPRRRTSAANWKKPLKWNNELFYECRGCHWRGSLPAGGFPRTACPICYRSDGLLRTRPRVFCASLADVFDNEVDPRWRQDLFWLITNTPNLDWLLLTKRIGNVFGMVPLPWSSKDVQHGPDPANIFPGGWPSNVWLGATIVNQGEADRDIPKLLAIPAAIHFLSMEPLIESVSLDCVPWPNGWRPEHDDITDGIDPLRYHKSHIDWVIVGGESGPNARPMHPNWARNIRDQCKEAGVPFLFKQWGEWGPVNILASESAESFEIENKYNFVDGEHIVKLGKKKAGRELDGITYTEFPNK